MGVVNATTQLTTWCLVSYQKPISQETYPICAQSETTCSSSCFRALDLAHIDAECHRPCCVKSNSEEVNADYNHPPSCTMIAMNRSRCIERTNREHSHELYDTTRDCGNPTTPSSIVRKSQGRHRYGKHENRRYSWCQERCTIWSQASICKQRWSVLQSVSLKAYWGTRKMELT